MIADGLAGRPHDREQLAYVKSATAAIVQGGEQSYHQRDRIYGSIAPALDAYGDTPSDSPMVAGHFDADDDPFLPLGLDSHRYRCCGNGVVTPVAEWLGQRLAAVL